MKTENTNTYKSIFIANQVASKAAKFAANKAYFAEITTTAQIKLINIYKYIKSIPDFTFDECFVSFKHYNEKTNKYKVIIIESNKQFIHIQNLAIKDGFYVEKNDLQILNYNKITITKIDGIEYQLMLHPNNTVNEIRRQLEELHGIKPDTYNLRKEDSNIYLNGFDKFNNSCKLIMLVYDKLPNFWKSKVTDTEECAEYKHTKIYTFYYERKDYLKFTKIPEFAYSDNFHNTKLILHMIYTISRYIEFCSGKHELNQSNINYNDLLIVYKKNLKTILENNNIFDKFEIYRKDKNNNNNSGRIIQIDLFK